jgi:5-methylcytosine-specific restriction protein A
MFAWIRSFLPMSMTARSGSWATVRRHHLASNPRCLICGGTKNVEVHHVVPVSVDPSLELEPSNLRTLCDAKGRECHRIFGHLFNWHTYNPEVDRTIAFWQVVRGQAKPCEKGEK